MGQGWPKRETTCATDRGAGWMELPKSFLAQSILSQAPEAEYRAPAGTVVMFLLRFGFTLDRSFLHANGNASSA